MGTMKAFLQRRKQSESGSTEVITTLFMIPIILWLILSLIDVSLYFQARTTVQNVARDSARQVAVWGGNESPLRPYEVPVNVNGFNALFNSATQTCKPGNCKTAPLVNCTPPLTAYAGQEVSCTVVYEYKAINPGNPLTGFTGFMNKPITITEYARAETGF